MTMQQCVRNESGTEGLTTQLEEGNRTIGAGRRVERGIDEEIGWWFGRRGKESDREGGEDLGQVEHDQADRSGRQHGEWRLRVAQHLNDLTQSSYPSLLRARKTLGIFSGKKHLNSNQTIESADFGIVIFHRLSEFLHFNRDLLSVVLDANAHVTIFIENRDETSSVQSHRLAHYLQAIFFREERAVVGWRKKERHHSPLIPYIRR